MAYCTRRGKDSQLQPILGSSPLVEAHLVNTMPSDVFSPPAVLPLMDLSKLPAFGSSLKNLREGQGSGIGQQVGSTRGEDMASEEAPMPRWQPRQLAHLRRLLLESSTFRSALKVDQLEFGKEETSADGRFHTFNIKRHSDQSYATCPYAGHMHSSNCMCLRYSHSHKEVTVHCYDEDCSFRASGKQRLRWSVILPEDNVRAMAAAFSAPLGAALDQRLSTPARTWSPTALKMTTARTRCGHTLMTGCSPSSQTWVLVRTCKERAWALRRAGEDLMGPTQTPASPLIL